MDVPVSSILHIDDDPISLKIVRAYLERMQNVDKVHSFKSALVALEYLKECGDDWPEVILCDLVMPLMTGWEFLEQYASLGYNKKQCLVCVHSSETKSVDLDDLEENKHVHMFIPKPINKDKIDQLFRFYDLQKLERFKYKSPLKYVLS